MAKKSGKKGIVEKALDAVLPPNEPIDHTEMDDDLEDEVETEDEETPPAAPPAPKQTQAEPSQATKTQHKKFDKFSRR